MWVTKGVPETGWMGFGNLIDGCFQQRDFIIAHPGTSRVTFSLRFRTLAIGWCREPPLGAAEGYSRRRARRV